MAAARVGTAEIPCRGGDPNAARPRPRHSTALCPRCHRVPFRGFAPALRCPAAGPTTQIRIWHNLVNAISLFLMPANRVLTRGLCLDADLDVFCAAGFAAAGIGAEEVFGGFRRGQRRECAGQNPIAGHKYICRIGRALAHGLSPAERLVDAATKKAISMTTATKWSFGQTLR